MIDYKKNVMTKISGMTESFNNRIGRNTGVYTIAEIKADTPKNDIDALFSTLKKHLQKEGNTPEQKIDNALRHLDLTNQSMNKLRSYPNLSSQLIAEYHDITVQESKAEIASMRRTMMLRFYSMVVVGVALMVLGAFSLYWDLPLPMLRFAPVGAT